MEAQPVWEVASALEGEQACAELRAHGIECDYEAMLQPSADLEGLPTFSLSELDKQRLYVFVAERDAERARTLLQAWNPGKP